MSKKVMFYNRDSAMGVEMVPAVDSNKSRGKVMLFFTNKYDGVFEWKESTTVRLDIMESFDWMRVLCGCGPTGIFYIRHLRKDGGDVAMKAVSNENGSTTISVKDINRDGVEITLSESESSMLGETIRASLPFIAFGMPE